MDKRSSKTSDSVRNFLWKSGNCLSDASFIFAFFFSIVRQYFLISDTFSSFLDDLSSTSSSPESVVYSTTGSVIGSHENGQWRFWLLERPPSSLTYRMHSYPSQYVGRFFWLLK